MASPSTGSRNSCVFGHRGDGAGDDHIPRALPRAEDGGVGRVRLRPAKLVDVATAPPAVHAHQLDRLRLLRKHDDKGVAARSRLVRRVPGGELKDGGLAKLVPMAVVLHVPQRRLIVCIARPQPTCDGTLCVRAAAAHCPAVAALLVDEPSHPLADPRVAADLPPAVGRVWPWQRAAARAARLCGLQGSAVGRVYRCCCWTPLGAPPWCVWRLALAAWRRSDCALTQARPAIAAARTSPPLQGRATVDPCRRKE